jgi:hypothetical protein
MATVYSNFTTPRTAPGSREAAAAQQARDVATYNTLASNPNVNFSGKKVSSRAEGGGTAQQLPTTPTTIPVTDLTKTETPVPIPKPVVAEPVYNLTDMTRDNASMGIGATTEMTPTTSQFETDMDVALRKRQEILGEAPSAEELFARREREMGIEQKQKTVNAYQTQLNQIVADAKARQLSVEGQGRGIPEVIIGGQQAQIAKEAAIQALPIQALLSAAQGDLTFAQNRLDTLARLEMQDAQLAYQNKKEMFSFAFDYATDQQKTRLAVAEKAADREWERERMNIQMKNDWAVAALKDGNRDIFNSIMSLDPKTSNFGSKLGLITQPLGQETITSVNLSRMQEKISTTADLATHTALDAAVGPNILARWSPVQWITGGRADFVAQVEQLRGELTLDNLINAKARGATFGALSDSELRILANSASKLGSWAIEDEGKVIGYKVSEEAFKRELDKINTFAKLDYIARGGNPADLKDTTITPDGRVWSLNSDNTVTQLK